MTVLKFPIQNPFCCFFIGNPQSLLPAFLSLEGFVLLRIHSKEKLKEAFLEFKPGLIFVEESVDWIHALELLDRLKMMTEIPRVLLIKKSKENGQVDLVKKAFQAGVLDVLFLPTETDNLTESLCLYKKVAENFSRI